MMHQASQAARWFAPLALVLGLCAVGQGTYEGRPRLEPADRRPIPDDAMLLHAEGDWLIWGQRVDDGRVHAKQPAVNRIYRQRVSGADAAMLLEQYDPTRLAVWGVLADGTTLICRDDMIHGRSLLVSIDARGRSTTRPLAVPGHEGEPFFTLAATPWGAVVQPARTRADGQSPLLFVPFEQGRVVEADTIRLSIHGPSRPFPARPIARSGTELAWADEHGVYVLDAATRQLRQVPTDPDDKPSPHHAVRGFDGEMIVLPNGVIDADTGTLLGKAPRLDPAVMRDGIGYFLEPVKGEPGKSAKHMALKAVPMLGGPTRTLATVEYFNLRVGSGVFATRHRSRHRSGHPYVSETELGIRIFTGDQSLLVPFPHES